MGNSQDSGKRLLNHIPPLALPPFSLKLEAGRSPTLSNDRCASALHSCEDGGRAHGSGLLSQPPLVVHRTVTTHGTRNPPPTEMTGQPGSNSRGERADATLDRR